MDQAIQCNEREKRTDKKLIKEMKQGLHRAGKCPDEAELVLFIEDVIGGSY